MVMAKKFSEEKVIDNLLTLCKTGSIDLPCRMDSWHGFDSSSPESLVELGRHLEKQGWRFVGLWPIHQGSKDFHLRVSRTGTYEEKLLLNEMERMEKISSRFNIEHYSDCSPQPHHCQKSAA